MADNTSQQQASLPQDVERVTQSALKSGALQSIDTRFEQITENNVSFLLRTLDSLKRKDDAAKRLKKAGDTRHNPFLPYEEALYVRDLGEHHVCLLNKFNVVEHHLLVVTREFEPQQNLINRKDFEALARVMQEIDGLAFYNGGKIAGASQPHKHLQLIPLPMAPFEELPFSDVVELDTDQPGQCEALEFLHAGIAFPDGLFNEPELAAERLTQAYNQLRETLGIEDDGQQAVMPYNLLITCKWMLMVPRSKEDFEGISFNSLAFVGALLVRNEKQAERLKAFGLMKALKSVC